MPRRWRGFLLPAENGTASRERSSPAKLTDRPVDRAGLRSRSHERRCPRGDARNLRPAVQWGGDGDAPDCWFNYLDEHSFGYQM